MSRVGDSERHRLRATFEHVAEQYDRVRPTYPTDIFGDLAALTGVASGRRVLEIGCGSGQATLPLAERGFDVVCVEPGEQLAKVAQRKLARFPRVQVINAPFEAWEPPDGIAFDTVVAFTAFHWIDPDVAYVKSRRLLREGGALAIVATQHVVHSERVDFWRDVQQDYIALGLSDDERAPPLPEAVPDLRSEIDSSGVFRTTAVRRYVWDVTYGADEYLAVLDTYSGHRALHDETRALLYARIRARIEATPGRTVTKSYLATLNVAKAL